MNIRFLVIAFLLGVSQSTYGNGDQANAKVPAHRFDVQKFAAKALQRPLSEVRELWKTRDGAIQLLKDFPKDQYLQLDSLSGPLAVAQRELSLVVARDRFDLGESVPVDYIVWQETPHKKPWRTKLGGVPWRPRDRPWPFSSRGDRHTFVLQVDISDSLDVLPKAILESRPKDHNVLLIFMSNEEAWADDEDATYMEWSPHHIESPCRAEDVPRTSFTVRPRAGLLFRGNEYPAECENEIESDEVYAIPEVPYWHSTTHSTHLGRVTRWIQGDERELGTEVYLTLGSFSPTSSWPYPDVEKLNENLNPIGDVFRRDEFMFGDGGAGYFLVSPAGKTSKYFTCY